MKVGFVGLGNLGLPCALAIERYGGYEVFAHDCSEAAFEPLSTGKYHRIEPGVEELLEGTRIRRSSPREIAQACDLVFVAVQTPHQPRFEGITPLPEDRADFDYTYLRAAVSDIAEAARVREQPLILNIVSTVLPGTMAREIEPLLGPGCALSYNPFFIAMGTTIADFMNPEFVLLGARDEKVLAALEAFYRTLHERPCIGMSVESAELTKVSYNTFIGLKLAFVNCLMEVCHKTGANVDDVTGALCQATDRLISPKYMRAGMGDGGGCHPRDNIAMSFLARKLGLSFDLFEAAMLAREGHARWLASEIRALHQATGLPVVLLGRAYKANSDLTAGSPALLLQKILEEAGVEAAALDPWVDGTTLTLPSAAIYCVTTDHDVFRNLEFPEGSVVVDPWGSREHSPPTPTVNLGRSAIPPKPNVASEQTASLPTVSG